MNYHLILREEVSEEIADAYNWYENQKENLGEEFLEEIYNSFNLLKSNPQYFGFIYQTRRRIVLKRFPYKVIYEIFDDEIVIFSVRHSRQKDKF